MRYLDAFKYFKITNDIDSICEKYRITNYTINEDGSVDVHDYVDLNGSSLTKLPLKFGKVAGHFDCSGNKLTSLEGSPKWVGDCFNCSANKLTSLEGSPKFVGDDFYCYENKLTSLEGCSISVVGDFDCYANPIYTIVGPWIDNFSLVELFNDYDIIQGDTIILDRLKDFYSEIKIELTDNRLKEISKYYKFK